MLTVFIIYLWLISVTSVYPLVEGFVENIEAIQHFEEVFDNAAKFAGSKIEEINESNRRLDSGESRNQYQRDTRQLKNMENEGFQL